MEAKNYRKLTVWRKAMKFVTEVYRTTKTFPPDELYGLTAQLRRAAVSLPSNLAEGYGRNSRADFRRFLQIAAGSLFEIQTQLEIAYNLEYIDRNTYNHLHELSREIDAMLAAFIRTLGRTKEQ